MSRRTGGSRPRHVYVAGPYTRGGTDANIRRAVSAADRLVEAGMVPFVPHSHFHLWDAEHGHGYEYWMTQCFAWVRRCDALVRLPGESSGADREAALARELGIPVFDGVDAALALRQPIVTVEPSV